MDWTAQFQVIVQINGMGVFAGRPAHMSVHYVHSTSTEKTRDTNNKKA